ncbi:rRNA-binding ribosome biosynthesis protein rpf2 [Irineochytrium annulatum]|nr:rRNA-binding ribosome biosynthesis protein rpf2 [Irineochytrium annulatum]
MVNLKGLEHVVSISVDGKGLIHIRCYMTTLLNKEGGGKLPKVELEECGPALEMELRRTRFGDEDIYKEALRVPKVLEPKKVKNIEHDSMGDKTGRIHMEKQDLSKLQTRKIKGLKRLQKEVKKGDMKKGGDATGGGRAVKRTKDDREAPRAAKKRKQMQQ